MKLSIEVNGLDKHKLDKAVLFVCELKKNHPDLLEQIEMVVRL